MSIIIKVTNNDIHEQVARLVRNITWKFRKTIDEDAEAIAVVLRREYGPMTDMHTAADEAAKVWMGRARKDEREIDLLNAKLAKAREALEKIAEGQPNHWHVLAAREALKDVTDV